MTCAQLPKTLPKTCPLPKQFLVAHEEEYCVGLPFWQVETKFDSLASVPVGTKGNDCLGCQPGSGPGPFIVVHNDGSQMGFIYPYVTVIDRAEAKSDQMSIETCGVFLFPGGGEECAKKMSKVTVQVNGDVTQRDATDLKHISEEYNIEYLTYDEINALMRQMCCFNFGSFGNCALPNHLDEITLDGYFASERNSK